MPEQTYLLSRVRVATPCPASWEAMGGDDRVRFCRLCDRNVYNLSEMSEAEVVSLLAGAEGRVCGRLYRRADGTVITKDCPVGLSALRRRASRAAGAFFAAVLSLLATGAARAQGRACAAGGDWLKVERLSPAASHAVLSGAVVDANGSSVPGVELRADHEETGRAYTARTDEEGRFRFAALPAGTYAFSAEKFGFMRFHRPGVTVGAGETLDACVTLEVGAMGEIVVAEPPDRAGTESRGGATAFRRRALRGLPF